MANGAGVLDVDPRLVGRPPVFDGRGSDMAPAGGAAGSDGDRAHALDVRWDGREG